MVIVTILVKNVNFEKKKKNKKIYLDGEKKIRKTVYQVSCNSEKNRFADVSSRGNQKCGKLIATWIVKTNKGFVVNIGWKKMTERWEQVITIRK